MEISRTYTILIFEIQSRPQWMNYLNHSPHFLDQFWIYFC